jgi:hypothetical protein
MDIKEYYNDDLVIQKVNEICGEDFKYLDYIKNDIRTNTIFQ